MKARTISVFIVVAGLALLFVVAFGAESSEVNAANQSYPNVLFESNMGDLTQTAHKQAVLDLTFTPAFTIYLPLTANNFSPYGFHPGQTLVDPEMDVSLACIDVIKLNSTLSESMLNSALGGGELLQATFDLRDVPTELTFNRIGVPQYALEYGWSVYVDVDNDPETGSDSDRRKGAEYSLGAMHFVFSPDLPISQSIPSGVQVNTWKHDPETGHWLYLDPATIEVDAEKDIMTLTGEIPVASESRLFFVTYDYNPGGAPEWDESSYSTSTGQGLQRLEFGVQQESGNETVEHWLVVPE